MYSLEVPRRAIGVARRLAAGAGVAIVAACVGGPAVADPGHGYALIDPLKYPAGFDHFDYVDPDAPKGGTLRLGAVGSYSSLNTLTWPARTPRGGAEGFTLRDLLYDSLLEQSADEVAGYYGLLAKTVETVPDHSWVRFTLDPAARWHDGTQVTAADVVFTFEQLAEKGVPFYRQALGGITATAEAPDTVLITAARPGDRQFVGLVGGIPIHPKHYWEAAGEDRDAMAPPLGSGPYRIAAATQGRSVTLERVPDYWAADHPVNRGRFNFDRIRVNYYRDATVAMEGFRVGEYDLRVEDDAVRWTTGYGGPDFDAGRIRRETFTQKTPGRLVGLVFNLRRPAFADSRVREALSLAYDFSWVNENLFHGLYQPVTSYFGETALAATGALSAAERDILGPRVDELPDDALEAPGPDGREDGERHREALRRAADLLDAAGFTLRDGARIDPATGVPFVVQVVFLDAGLERVLATYANWLKHLGVTLDYRWREPGLASKMLLDHDFDMAALRQWSPGLLPGLSERLLWGSALADRQGSYALSGVKNPALDRAIEAMNTARTRKNLQAAARLFDRLMRWGRYMLPLYRSNRIWVAWRDRFGYPDTDAGRTGFVDIWWRKPGSAGD
ncbi:microcin C transport system substrate-binding protein [Rhodobium orientis]|uniref:Solute-binding protein family 5 domain-containing protein n=1 Tax=Rhodobium orientis TaxID=34017 RepID=A0A327JGE6_9HYPH|nr:extracellular solute-binding protein [Rhodobium orientis]MBB4303196.1 microcin C transport system substrate-binding protein [Rhodobium orientis]MBK5951703.1 hypothetical protein [Rhodobium orientis]RAI25001.1 hypothetical protein CH339_20210 [Rhodobium orientis]